MKWHMANRLVTSPMTSRDLEGQSRDPNVLVQIFYQNSIVVSESVQPMFITQATCASAPRIK